MVRVDPNVLLPFCKFSCSCRRSQGWFFTSVFLIMGLATNRQITQNNQESHPSTLNSSRTAMLLDITGIFCCLDRKSTGRTEGAMVGWYDTPSAPKPGGPQPLSSHIIPLGRVHSMSMNRKHNRETIHNLWAPDFMKNG